MDLHSSGVLRGLVIITVAARRFSTVVLKWRTRAESPRVRIMGVGGTLKTTKKHNVRVHSSPGSGRQHFWDDIGGDLR